MRTGIARLKARRQQLDDSNFIGFDKYTRAGAYHWDEMDNSPDYRAKAEFVLRHVGQQHDVLDVGCGDGAYMHRLASACHTITGIDADPEAVRLARTMLRKHGDTNATVHRMPISNVTLEAFARARPFDVVYSMDVIEHLPDPTEICERIAIVAGSDTQVIIGTPNYLGDELVSPYHVQEFTAAEFRSLLEPYIRNICLHHLPMRRSDNRVHDDGFLVIVGEARDSSNSADRHE